MPIIQEPADLPRWADDPPVGPPDTITEPTEGEKDEGWQPPRAQVSRIEIDNVVDSTLYTVTINGTDCEFTSSGSATDTEIRDGLIADITAEVGAAVTPAADGSAAIEVTANVTGVPFTISDADANLTTSTTTANRTGRPRRQYMNWLQWLAYLWLRFLSAVRFRWSDIGDDWHVPGTGTSPTTGATLVGTSGQVTAYIQGRRVFGESEAHTYGPSADTYVDLDRDGDWIFTPVAVSDPAPALASNSLRVFMVRTNATDRTAVTSYVGTHVQFDQYLDFNRTARYGEGRRASAAQYAEARRQIHHGTAASGGYTLLDEYINESDGVGSRLYMRHSDRVLVRVRNAAWNGTQWTRDSLAAVSMSPLGDDANGTTINPGLAVEFTPSGTPFADSEFYADASVGGLLRRHGLSGTVYAGRGLIADAYNRSLPRFEAYGDSSHRTHTLRSEGSRWWGLPNGGGMSGRGPGGEWGVNCTFSEVTGQWSRVASEDAFLLEFTSSGLRLFIHIAALAGSWDDDDTDPANWTPLFTWDFTLLNTLSSITANQMGCQAILVDDEAQADCFTPNSNPSGAPVAHGIYRGNVVKARALVETDGIGGITVVKGFNVASVALTGGTSGRIEVTLDRPMIDADYEVVANSYSPDLCNPQALTDSTFEVGLWTLAGIDLDLGDEARRVAIVVTGDQ